MTETSNHIGRKISRIRELRGMKQEALAAELGVSQQAVSKMEQSENIEEEVLERIAKVLGVPTEAIKNFSDEAVINIISSTLHNTSGLVNYNPNFTFNPIEKIVELYNEKVELLERLLQSEREKVEILKGKNKD
jgi:transcriptional regulator with XRE-family HTH domain